MFLASEAEEELGCHGEKDEGAGSSGAVLSLDAAGAEPLGGLPARVAKLLDVTDGAML
jgi:hypothetical protein